MQKPLRATESPLPFRVRRPSAFGLTNVGHHRKRNEDRIAVRDDLGLFVVADGMGGHRGGKLASRIATSVIERFVAAHDDGARNQGTLELAVTQANREVHGVGLRDYKRRGMGSTVVAGLLDRDARTIHIAHVGDSRAYLIRDRQIEQKTRDHSLVSEARAFHPELSEEAIERLPKNIVTRALGIQPEVKVDSITLDLKPGDVVLLCSDGLSGQVSDREMLDACLLSDSPEEACDLLVTMANEAGGVDNVSVVLITFPLHADARALEFNGERASDVHELSPESHMRRRGGFAFDDVEKAVCPECQFDVLVNAKYCVECGLLVALRDSA